ncbi:prefoldin domain-containing protein [Erythrobacter aurantius]|uniref:hypothetical protein n=1 Tax=Erythrobacter aurantius TaxID=2909249 RepID=UPI00207A166A|nr:hypothetical protein [Erythrobacter aurantius]
MGFRLRGGRPKNMGQGIYWVQRHLADSRAAERRRVAEQRRVEKQNEAARKFNEKWHRISSNVTGYFTKYADVDAKASEAKRDKIVEKINEYNNLKDFIQNNIESASMGDLSKLATAGRACVLLCAKARGQKAAYDAGSKILMVEGVAYDFS